MRKLLSEDLLSSREPVRQDFLLAGADVVIE